MVRLAATTEPHPAEAPRLVIGPPRPNAIGRGGSSEVSVLVGR